MEKIQHAIQWDPLAAAVERGREMEVWRKKNLWEVSKCVWVFMRYIAQIWEYFCK